MENENKRISESGKIRVLHVLSTLVPGGVQSVILGYADSLKNSDVIFDYVVQGDGNHEIERKVENNGSIIYKLTSLSKHPIRFAKELYKLLKQHPEYQIVHVHLNYLNFLPLFISSKAGVTVRISHSHSDRITKAILVKFIRVVIRSFIVFYATDLWACSDGSYQWLYNKKLKNKYILRNAIDDKRFLFNLNSRTAYRNELSIADEFLCVCVGTLSKIKNQTYLLDVFKQLASDRKYKLIIVGEGVCRNELSDKICEIGLDDSVKLLGRRLDIPQLLSASDCFLLPSLTEGLPLSVIEAQVNGLPCIVSSNVTQDIKLSENVTFLNIGSDSINDWASKIKSLDSNKYNRENNNIDAIKESGYLISVESGKLYSKYKELFNRCVIH